MGLFDGQTVPEVLTVPAGGDQWSAIALRVEALAHTAGWHDAEDSPTDLFWLREHPVPEGLGFGVSIGVPDVPDDAKAVHPLPLLEMIERVMRRPGRDLLGFAMVVEAWAAVSSGDDEADRLAGEGRLRDYAGRIEVRQAHLITLDGQERVVIRARDQEPMVQVVGPNVGGAVPEAMRRLAANLRRRKYGRRG